MQALLQTLQQFAGAGKRVGRPTLGRVGVVHQRQFAGQVVNDGQRFHQHEQDVGRTDRVRVRRFGFSLCQARLDVAYGVVTEDADQTAAKARQRGLVRHLEAGLIGSDVG